MAVKCGRVLGCVVVAVVSLGTVLADNPGDRNETAAVTQQVLDGARQIIKLRSVIIADNLGWTVEFLTVPPERLDSFRLKIAESLRRFAPNVSDDWARKKLHDEQMFWESMKAQEVREMLVLGQLRPLCGILRPEFGRWVLGLRTVRFLEQTGQTGMRRDWLAALATSTGRPASLEIVRILRKQKDMPAAERDRLIAILREVEQDAADVLLASKTVSVSPEPPIPEPERDGRELSFALLPLAPFPGYDGHSEKAFMRLGEKTVVADPQYLPDDWQSEESVDRMHQRQANLGDFAFTKTKLLVGSNRAAVLKSPLWADTFTAQGLSPDLLGPTPEIDPRQSPLVLMETATGDLGLVQILPEFNGEIPVAYVVVPPNRATSHFRVRSMVSFVTDANELPAYGAFWSRGAYLQARMSWWFDGYKNATTSLCDLLTPDSDVSPEDKVQAIRLLGELRSVDDADTLVRLIADDQPQTLQSAAEAALTRMMPRARYVFQTRLKTAKGPSRERLLKVFRRLEGDEVAEFLLDLWVKEDAK